MVLLNGWGIAVVLDHLGTAVWDRIDGVSSVGEIAAAIPTVDPGEVAELVSRFGRSNLLANVEPEPDGQPPLLTPVPQPEVGDTVAPLTVTDLDGLARSLTDVAGGDVLLVSWNPHCGYCASIAMELASLHDPLRKAGTTLVFLAFGDAADNRELAERASITAPVLLLGDADNPFGGAGTPSAFHLGADRKIVAAAYGNIEVPALARTLAGADDNPTTTDDEPKVQYLLERDGLCAAGTGTTGGPTWTDTVVYRIGDHHVGVRVDSAATAAVLDRLFDCKRVEDPRAGHSYSVALPSVADGADGSGPSGLNLLVQPGRATVRSRDPGRILKALLADLHDRVHNTASAADRRRVNAVAVGVNTPDGWAGGLIPLNFLGFAPRLQSLLAERGVALCDTPHPELDLATGDLVIPEPAVPHDPAVIDDVTLDLTGIRGELPPLPPGSYPFHGWCVIHPGEQTLVAFSPAESAAATISFLSDATDPVVAVQEMGELFRWVPAFGLWYYSEVEVADLVARALGASS